MIITKKQFAPHSDMYYYYIIREEHDDHLVQYLQYLAAIGIDVNTPHLYDDTPRYVIHASIELEKLIVLYSSYEYQKQRAQKFKELKKLNLNSCS